MNKLELMQQFMNTFVGKDFHLLIKEREGTFQVHTIEIMQKTDNTCPVEEISIGDHFLHLIATDLRGNEAAMVCNWSEELLQNLLDAYKEARDADFSNITMCRNHLCNDNDNNQWLLIWGNNNSEGQAKTSSPIAYAS
jgi:hypothetical protein